MRITKGIKKEAKKTLERALKNEEIIKGLYKERDDALVEIARGKRNLKILQEGMEDEVGGLKNEIRKQARAWEEEKKKWMEKKAGTTRKIKMKRIASRWRESVRGVAGRHRWTDWRVRKRGKRKIWGRN